MTERQRTYLFLLRSASPGARREGVRLLKELGAVVLAQYGDVAIEALATPDQAAAAAQAGVFAAQATDAIAKEDMERLVDEQREVVAQWNVRFSSRYRRAKRENPLRGRSWGDPDDQVASPLPYSTIDPEDFIEAVQRFERETGRKLLDEGPKRPARRTRKAPPAEPAPEGRPRLSPEEFTELERRLADRYKDETFAYHLVRLAYRLDRRHVDLLLDLPDELVDWLRGGHFEEAACWRMTGEMSVGLVFVESSQTGGPKFSTAERNEVRQEIIDGLNWLASQHPAGNLSWVYDYQYVTINVANGTDESTEAYWRNPAMGQVNYHGDTFSASWSGVAEYRAAMRAWNRSDHALVIFVTPYGTDWYAYAGGGRVTLAKRNNWGGWGRATLDTIAAHEVAHLFGSSDEYTGSGTPCSSCTTLHGCERIPNGNCGACARPRQTCVMDRNSRRLCPWTRAHIGWSHLFAELTTADENWAGTDDDVTLDIGDRTWTLDTQNHDDRERNNIDGYPIWAPSLERSQIKRVLIRKSSDGYAGGWKLARVRVWFGGEIICTANPNRWLEDDHRFWVGCRAPDTGLVNTLEVRVTTGDVSFAGTDDDVTLTLAGFSWNLDNEDRDDFERGRTDTFKLDPRTGLYRSAIHSIRIHKSPDGAFGGWRLKGVQLIVNGTTIYNNAGINRWLEDDTRTWTASV